MHIVSDKLPTIQAFHRGSANQCILGDVYLRSNLSRDPCKYSDGLLRYAPWSGCTTSTQGTHLQTGNICHVYNDNIYNILLCANKFLCENEQPTEQGNFKEGMNMMLTFLAGRS